MNDLRLFKLALAWILIVFAASLLILAVLFSLVRP